VAHSPSARWRALARRAAAARRRVFAGVLAEDRIIVARDPHGFRPLAMGRWNFNGHTCYVFASETCAFDLIGAVYLHDVEPGEMVIVGPEGITRERYAPERPLSQCVFEHVYFSRPDSIVFGRPVQESREMLGRAAGARSIPPTPMWWCRCRIPAWPRPSAIPPNPGCRSARR
jgi:amidophosphoribosyltransferase